MNKKQLAQKIWASANQMRSKIEANEYKDYILGFMFYKYLSDREEKFLRENGYDDELLNELDESDREVVEWIQENLGYFIGYKHMFSTWVNMKKDFSVEIVRESLLAFNRLISANHKKVFDKIFETLNTGLSKLGESAGGQTKSISALIALIQEIPMDRKQDYDVLGFVYEYLISMFAANAGKKAGEFYTPHEVSVLMSEIVANHLKERTEIEIYDPTSGSGSLLINIGKSVEQFLKGENRIKYYAQELKENTYNLTRMNLVMRGIKPDNIVTRNGDTLEDDWPYFEEDNKEQTYAPLYVDAVVSNPPYSQVWDPSDKKSDPRYAKFGLAPKSKADYAFLLHDLFHIKPDGIMTIVLPHGVLFRGGEEGEIRKNLLENNHIDAIIGLPANIFFGTGIPTIIMVLRQKRENTDVLIVDASKSFEKEGKNNKLRASDIKKITDTVVKRENVKKFSKVVSIEEIRRNDYNLNIPRYVDSSEEAESWDIYASMFGGIPESEIDKLSEFWCAFPNLRKDLFVKVEGPYAKLPDEEAKGYIEKHRDVVEFKNNFNARISTLPDYMAHIIIDNIEKISIPKAKTNLSDYILESLEGISIIDKYEAYQIFDDEWANISMDLEILQTEGMSAIKKVDAKMVTKKREGKEVEIQEGWEGRIIPFDLIQKNILKHEYDELENFKRELNAIPDEINAIMEDMSDEERDMCGDAINEDTFVNKEISKQIKEMEKYGTEESRIVSEKLKSVDTLIKKEKELKNTVKNMSVTMQTKCKDAIENLTDEESMELLAKKWIEPAYMNLHNLSDCAVYVLVSKVDALKNKYKTTFYDVEKEIRETEILLAGMIDELEGNEFDMKGLSEFKSLLIGE